MQKTTFDLVCFGHASLDTIQNITRTTSDLVGGAAVYTAVIAASLGIRTALVTRIGQENIKHFFEVFQAQKVDTAGVKVLDGPSTRLTLHYHGQEFQSIDIIPGVGEHLVPEDIPDHYYSTKMAYVAPGPLETQELCARLMKERNVLVIFDPHADYNELPLEHTTRILQKTDVYFANEMETLALTKQQELEEAIAILHNIGVNLIIVTLGNRGSIISSNHQQIRIPALQPTSLIDVIGAGDAYKAGFLVGLRCDLPLGDCGFLGAATATCILETVGMNVVPTQAQVTQVLARHNIRLNGWHERFET